ncbi:NAD(P)-binding protein [Hymenopellis radicata]|nr:NAD(P)-binding protein [Hymenopellis radicata]
MTLNILLTGATGFVGGTTLATLLTRGGDVQITCLVRGQERAATIEKKFPGVRAIVADLDDINVVKEAASNADVILHTANADHPKGAQALVDGLEEHYTKTGKKGVLIHSSGTGALADDARGQYASDKIYEDLDCADIRAIPITYVHRATDTVVTSATERGIIRGYVVMPPLIYGRGTGPYSRTSVQLPALIRGALKYGRSPYIGQGLGMWNGVHVQDLVDLYIIIMEDALSESPKAPTGDEGYYLCATDTYQWKELAVEIGKRLYAKGVIDTPEPYSVTDAKEELDIFGRWSEFAYASNSRSKAGKAYQLGWKPKHHTDGLLNSIDAEHDAVVEEGSDLAPKVHFDEMYALGI